MNAWDKVGQEIERGPEPEDELHYSDFLVETGRLSGASMVTLAQRSREAAAKILDDFTEVLDDDEKPADLAETLALVEWDNPEQALEFMDAIDKEE